MQSLKAEYANQKDDDTRQSTINSYLSNLENTFGITTKDLTTAFFDMSPEYNKLQLTDTQKSEYFRLMFLGPRNTNTPGVLQVLVPLAYQNKQKKN